jgi:hypothetical protein
VVLFDFKTLINKRGVNKSSHSGWHYIAKNAQVPKGEKVPPTENLKINLLSTKTDLCENRN